MRTHTPDPAGAPGGVLARSIGLHGRTAVLGAMAGGIAVGGVLVATLTLSGRLSAHAIFLNATGLFILGALLGLIHGVALGLVGRPAGVTLADATRDMGRAVLYAVPGLAVAWLITIWVAMSLVAAYAGRTGPLVGVALGWVAAGMVMAAAAVHAWRAVRNGLARWPERRPGMALVVGTLVALLVLLATGEPGIWGTRLRLTPTGGALLSVLITLWVVGPLVTYALRITRRLPFPTPVVGARGGRNLGADLGLAAVVGIAAGVLAAPFALPPHPATGAQTILVAVGGALVTEVLLRLILLTAAAWLLLRILNLPVRAAFVGAILVATAVQTALFAPGAVTMGFPVWTRTATYLVLSAGIPGLAFGFLYWRRGFLPAVVADAAASVVLLLLATVL